MTSSPRPNKPREHFLVAVLKLLPEDRRERALYVSLGAGLVALWIGVHHAPGITAAGGVVWQVVKSWFGK